MAASEQTGTKPPARKPNPRTRKGRAAPSPQNPKPETRNPKPETRDPRPKTLLIAIALAIAAIIVYWPLHGYDFINFDDPAYVKNNAHVTTGLTWANVAWAFTTDAVCNWHPLTWLSLMLDVRIFGVNPGGHHLVNVLFHAANAVLLFLVLGRMTGAQWRSALVAALFALHPLHVESVAWIAERKDVLSTLFWLLTMASYLHYVKRPGMVRYVGIAVPFALGLLAKPMLVTLPAVLLLLDYWPLNRTGQTRGWTRDCSPLSAKSGGALRLIAEKIPLLALAALSSAATMFAQGSGGGVVPFNVIPLPQRIANAVVAYARYIEMTCWPAGLAIFYPHARGGIPLWQLLGSVVLLVVISAVVLYLARAHPYLLVGWLWYLGTLVPVIGIVQVGDQALADRYTYVPLIGLFILLAWGVRDFGLWIFDFGLKRRSAANDQPEITPSPPHPKPETRNPKLVLALGMAAGIALVALTICTGVQVRYWKDTITLFERALAVTANNRTAHKALGVALADDAHRYADAAEHCRKAIALDPQDADLHYNLGNALLAQDQVDDAIAAYQKATALSPDYVNAYYNLGNAYARQKRYAEASAAFTEGLERQPDNPDVNNNLGSALVCQGKFEEALAPYQKSLQLRPDNVDACCNLGYTLSKLGRAAEAARYYQQALRLDPRCARAQDGLNKLSGTPASQ